MGASLQWKEGEGYDLHVLRGGPSSKPLDKSFVIDPQFAQTPVVFEAHFNGAPNSQPLGVQVDTTTGVAKAVATTASPKLRNFVMTARLSPVGGTTFETVIRVHVHDSIQKMWLTPSTLTAHEGADESRFTILALFDDGIVGDITDWPQLTYAVLNPTSLPIAAMTVKVLNRGDLFDGEPEPIGGRLRVFMPQDPAEDGSQEVEVTLGLPAPLTNLTAKAKVFPKPDWADLAKDRLTTKLQWVPGPKPKPNEADLGSNRSDSVKSVFARRANVLFISEGFLPGQEQDFRKKVVEVVVNELRTQDTLEPFKLLNDSINYWSVFVPSTEDCITMLGEYGIDGASTGEILPPQPPPAGGAPWGIEHMMHEAGLPIPSDAAVADPSAWATGRANLYALPAAPPVDKKTLSDWNDLRQRTILNERATAFGMAHADRPRASGQGSSSLEHLGHDPRRISVNSIKAFVENLQFDGMPVGSTWEDTKPDFRRVCFVCKSARTGGTATLVYFAAATGLAFSAQVEPATTNGTQIKPRQIDKKSFSVELYASIVAHECGHALGLGDEYASPNTFDPNVNPIPSDPNVQPDTLMAPVNSSGARIFDTTQIKWLWPRVSKAALLDGPPDFQGAPDPPQFLVRLRKGQGKPFKKDDLVRIRETPVRRVVSSDPYAGILLKVDIARPDSADVSYVNAGGTHVDLTVYNPSKTYELICTSIVPGQEFQLVPASIASHIGATNRPLNADPAPPVFACVPGRGRPTETPVNLPPLSKTPKSKSDIIGLYEGGGYHDCGVFRPAGRCRMRSGMTTTIPFCYVCRYLIVDAIDPTQHGVLDKLHYPEVQP